MLNPAQLLDCLKRELVEVLCSEDPCFKNVVVWALASSKDELHLELPQRELAPSAAAEPLKADLLVPVTVKGRTSCELLVQPSYPGQACGRLVAVHYATLLKSASLDALLALADRIQAHVSMRSSSWSNSDSRPSSPSKTALITMQQVARAVTQHRASAAAAAASAASVGAPSTPTLAAAPVTVTARQLFA